MNTYEFRGTFTFMVQAESQESAELLLDEQLSEVLMHWHVDEVSS